MLYSNSIFLLSGECKVLGMHNNNEQENRFVIENHMCKANSKGILYRR